jgi:pSer/pThr/pTyr-binding forkhead associated (FHA) protein
MQDVTITFTAGPMKDGEFEFEVGNLPIGRQPGPNGLELMHADQSVSRVHAELVEHEGQITLQNHSPNGTTVAGKLVLDTVPIRPGTKVQVGNSHVFEVSWTSFTASQRDKGKDKKGQNVASQGLLASPLVRSVIGVYLLGMVVLVIWLSISGGDRKVTDDWPQLAKAYAAYQPEGVSAETLSENAARAEILVHELRVFKTQGQRNNVRQLCREIMSIDQDINSPLFRYGARCLGSRYF